MSRPMSVREMEDRVSAVLLSQWSAVREGHKDSMERLEAAKKAGAMPYHVDPPSLCLAWEAHEWTPNGITPASLLFESSTWINADSAASGIADVARKVVSIAISDARGHVGAHTYVFVSRRCDGGWWPGCGHSMMERTTLLVDADKL